VGGTFTTAGGKPASYVAKWDLSGTGNTDWTALGSGVDGPVTSIAAKGNELYVSGSFNSAGGKSAAAIAKWNTWASNDSGWSALGTGISGSSPPAGIFVLGSELVVFGQSLIVTGVNVGSIAKWNTAATDNSGWSGWSDGGKIMAIATSGSNIYVGGQFNAIGGITASNIAMWNGTAWSALGTGLNGPVNALALHGLNLYAGGTLSISYLDENYDLAYSYGIAKWNGTSWSRLGSGLDASVHALALSGSTLYVGGDFTNNASNPVSYIASWNTAASDDSGWAALDSGLNGPVRALITSGTDLYAGGEFTSASGTQANLIAKWNGSTWSALGDGLAGESVRALAISGSDLYAAGKFGTSNGIALNNIAKWDGSAWDALGTGVIGQVNAMAISGLDLFVGGEFIRSGRSNLAKWTLGSSTDIGWSSAAIDVNSDPVFALTAAGATIYQGSAGKMSRWATNLVASVTSFSATGDSSGAYLAYVSRTNLRPNLTSFTAGAWGTTPLQLSTNTVSPSISLGMAPDTFGTGTAKWVVAWERNGNIEYRAMRLGTLTKVTTRASGSNNYNPSLPESILTNFIPVIWTKGSTSPYQLNANIISVTP
jgi:hypothetical protein